ncbi:MAG: TonB-dependent receptor [Gammaproteobacteria bacterium]
MSRYPGSPRLILAAAIAAVLHATPVAAAEGESVDEVIVTAQKRAERLQDVPISITAFQADAVEQRGLTNIESLDALAPNLSVARTPGNSTAAQISIRGGVQNNPALFWDPTVGMYLDGVYLGKTQGSVFDVVDLERVEVLRGPQGTLYGRNTLAGAVNFVTRKPSGEWGGTASASFGNYGAQTYKFSLDLPKAGIASFSVGLASERRDGWVKNTFPGAYQESLNDRDNRAARVSANFAFSDTFQADYRFDYTKTNQASQHSQLSRVLLPFLSSFVVSGERAESAALNGQTFERLDMQGHSLTFTWDLDEDTQVKSISAYRKFTWDDSLDLDGSPLSVAETQRLSDYKSKSQELQVVGKSGPVNYVAGLYWFEDDGFTANPQTFFFGTFNFDSNYGFGTRAYSAYGQLDFEATDALTLTAGLRYTNERKSIDRNLGVNFALGTPFIPLFPAGGTQAEKTFDAVTPLLNAAWKVNDDLNVYLKYSEGFKSGGFNGEYGVVGFTPAVIAGNAAETQTPFKPEKVKSLELGVKASLLDGALTVNAAAFQNKTKDLQLAIFTAQGAAASVVRNAGKATSKGLEVEASWRVSDKVRWQAGAGLLDVEYDEFIDGGVNVANNRAVIHAPKVTFSTSVDAELLRDWWGSVRFIADYSYKGLHYLYPYQLSGPGQAGHNPGAAVAGDKRVRPVGLANARLVIGDIKAGEATGEISLYGTNLTNRKHAANYIDFGPGFGSLTPVYYIDPRMGGIEFKLRW